MTSFSDLHVVVTGATGELGSAVAELLVERGALLHLPVRSADKLSAGIKRARVAPHVVEGIDLADETAVRGFYRDLSALWASIHCAGAFLYGSTLDATAADLEKMIAVNARSAFLCSREAARVMRVGSRGGRIVNVIARQALDPRRGASMVPYTMSKAAVAALTVALSEELAADGILVNAVAPSIIDTPANRTGMPDADFSRWVKPADLARTILALADRECLASGTLAPVYGRA